MGSLVSDLLKPEAPILEFYTEMNKLFLLLDINEKCSDQHYASITVTVIAWNEYGVVSTWNRTYPRYQINIRQNPEGHLPYNIWVDLDNYEYTIELYFNYDSDSTGTGGNSYQSKISTINFNNLSPTLTSSYVSSFFVGSVKDNLSKTKEFTMWVDKTDGNYSLNDLVSNTTGTQIRQVTNINGDYPNQQIQVLAANNNYMNIIKYIMNHERFEKVMENIISGINNQIDFILYLNNMKYNIHFRGNLQQLVKGS